MKNAFKELLESKKFIAAVIAVVVWGIGLAGLDLSSEQVGAIVSPLYAYIIGQAFADRGKSAEKIRAESAAATYERIRSSSDATIAGSSAALL